MSFPLSSSFLNYFFTKNNTKKTHFDSVLCIILSVSDGGVFDFAYDMGSLQEDKIDGYFPPEFKDMWDAYTKTGERYQKVPPEISFCLKADPTVPEYSIPPFASVLPALYYIKAVEELSVTSSELQNYKLLAAELPLDENGVPTMTYETAMEYYDHISNNLAEMIGLCITPFKIKDFTFDKSSESSQVNSVSRATENFFAAAGTSAQLHGIANDTSSVTKLAIKVDEAYSFVYVEQCEQIINRFLKLMSGTQKFKIRFLPVTQFNKPEMIEYYKGALNYGIGKLEYIACVGIPQYDVMSKAFIENEVLGIDGLFEPFKTASTRSAEEASSGRPAETDSEIEDAGEKTRDSGANENR